MRRVLPATLVILVAAILMFFFGDPSKSSADSPDTTTTTTALPPPGAPCNATAHFFAADVTGHKFGPAAPTTAPEAVAELKRRISCGQDAALAVAAAEYVQCNFTTPEQRVTKTVDAISNGDAWNMTAAAVAMALDAGNPRIETMSGSYKTLYMTLDGGRVIPEVYATNPDRPSFPVLRIDTPCGVKNFKLDCGFQPVEQSFPKVIPIKPGKPSKVQPPKGWTPPTHTAPPATQPPGTVATTTTPPPPTTVKCPPAPATCDPTALTPANPAYVPPVTLPPTPAYVPGAAEGAAPSNPTNGVITPPGAPSSPGTVNGVPNPVAPGADAPVPDTNSGRDTAGMPAQPG